jgi:MarR family transcriptional regulator, organic hydroperoxide resistance regulator
VGERRLTQLDEQALNLGEVLEFLRVIWQVDHALQRTSKWMEATLGVTGPQRLVLRIVGRFPGMLAGELASVLHLHPSTLTGVLKRLEAQGLLRRRPDPSDARKSMLSLTAKGRKFDVDSRGTVEARVAQVLARTAPGKVEVARVLLMDIAAVLSDTVDSGDNALDLPKPRTAPKKRKRGRNT